MSVQDGAHFTVSRRSLLSHTFDFWRIERARVGQAAFWMHYAERTDHCSALARSWDLLLDIVAYKQTGMQPWLASSISLRF